MAPGNMHDDAPHTDMALVGSGQRAGVKPNLPPIELSPGQGGGVEQTPDIRYTEGGTQLRSSLFVPDHAMKIP